METNLNISGITVQIKETNLDTGKNITITEYVAGNTIVLDLLEGSYEFEFIMDDSKTTGKDYYAMQKVIADSDQQQVLYAFPVASLRGKTIDELHNLVGDIRITLECDRDVPSTSPIITDKLGSFTFSLVPIGNCLLTASDEDQDNVNQQEIAFNRGDLEVIELKLESSSQRGVFIFLVIVVVLVMGIAGAIYFYLHRKTPTLIPEPKVVAKRTPQKRKAPSKADTILPTLREREQAIVNFLLESKGTSTQAKIKFATKIPKTSLMRILDTLQGKKIVEIDATNEVKTVRLTPWFLEK